MDSWCSYIPACIQISMQHLFKALYPAHKRLLLLLQSWLIITIIILQLVKLSGAAWIISRWFLRHKISWLLCLYVAVNAKQKIIYIYYVFSHTHGEIPHPTTLGMFATPSTIVLNTLILDAQLWNPTSYWVDVARPFGKFTGVIDIPKMLYYCSRLHTSIPTPVLSAAHLHFPYQSLLPTLLPNDNTMWSIYEAHFGDIAWGGELAWLVYSCSRYNRLLFRGIVGVNYEEVGAWGCTTLLEEWGIVRTACRQKWSNARSFSMQCICNAGSANKIVIIIIVG